MRTEFIQRVVGKQEKLEKEVFLDCLLEVAEERDLLNLIFDRMIEGVMVFDESETLRFANAQAGDLLGFNPTIALRTEMDSFLEVDEIRESIRRSLRTGDSIREDETAILGSKPVVLRTDIIPLRDDSGRFGGVLVFLLDVTERKKRQAQLRETRRLSALATLSASLAHELRNPLNSMGIHAQLLARKLRETGDEQLYKRIEIIQDEIQNLNEKLTSFLDAARPRKPQFESVSIHDLIEETLKLMKPELETAGVEPEYYPPSVHTTVFADRVDLRRAFVNIMKNSLEATPPGGRLIIRTGVEDKTVTITFEDTGHGISDENLDRIFELGFSTKDTGSGLGLPQVDRCVHEHFGKLDIESEEGEGTKVTIGLPIHEQGRMLLEMAPAAPRLSASKGLKADPHAS